MPNIKVFRCVLLCVAVAACGGDDGDNGHTHPDGGGTVGGPYLPLGTTLMCAGTDKAAGIDGTTGDVVCEADIDTDTDTDTDTLYTAGPGLVLDGQSFSVEFSDFACPGTDKLVGFEGGVPVCQPDQQLMLPQVPRSNSIVVVDDDGGTGRFASITMGGDGLPVIAYKDTVADGLRVAKCVDPYCAGPAIITLVDDPGGLGDVGDYASIAIGTDGFPMVSYYDRGNTALKVIKCIDSACAVAVTPSTVDTGGANDVGRYTSLAIGVDGRPIVSYYDMTNGELEVVQCDDVACAGGGEILTTVDGIGAADVGLYSSIAIGTDGLPIIAYHDTTGNALWVAKCGNAACSVGNALNMVDGGGDDVGRFCSIAIGADRFPVISYRDATNLALKVAKCLDPACAAAQVSLVDGAGADVGEHTSITIAADGLPVVAYHDVTGGALMVAKCGDAACSAGINPVRVDAGMVGLYTSITVGADGLPMVAYRDDTMSHLKAVKCANPFCLPFWSHR